MADTITRPDLTLPSPAADALRAAYAQADAVLEYGSGGSTLLAAEAGAEVWAVESDASWAAMMQIWFVQNASQRPVHIQHIDIGDTRDWGHPVSDATFRRWPDYALKVWDSPGFRHPDVVLIDGRFRLGCFLTVAYRISRPVTVFFDDYARRTPYHKAEDLVPPTRMIGRMARFDLMPTPLLPNRIRAYARALLQPV